MKWFYNTKSLSITLFSQYRFFLSFFLDMVVKLVSGGSVINKAYPIHFYLVSVLLSGHVKRYHIVSPVWAIFSTILVNPHEKYRLTSSDP